MRRASFEGHHRSVEISESFMNSPAPPSYFYSVPSRLKRLYVGVHVLLSQTFVWESVTGTAVVNMFLFTLLLSRYLKNVSLLAMI